MIEKEIMIKWLTLLSSGKSTKEKISVASDQWLMVIGETISQIEFINRMDRYIKADIRTRKGEVHTFLNFESNNQSRSNSGQSPDFRYRIMLGGVKLSNIDKKSDWMKFSTGLRAQHDLIPCEWDIINKEREEDDLPTIIEYSWAEIVKQKELENDPMIAGNQTLKAVSTLAQQGIKPVNYYTDF